MRLLAIDTSTDACSAALLYDGAVLSRYQLAPRLHADLILGMVQAVLDESGLILRHLDALAFCRGPGSFTGLRIAAGVAQGIAFASDLPVIPVSSLATMAQQCWQEQQKTRVLAGLDARLGEVYWGQYMLNDRVMCLLGDERVCHPDAVFLPDGQDWYGVGPAWAVYSQVLVARLGSHCQAYDDELLPNAAYMLELARHDWQNGRIYPAEQAQPVYLRNKVTDSGAAARG